MQKGHVVCVNIYDVAYWAIFLDGKLVEEVQDQYFTDSVFLSKNRKAWAKTVGVDVNDLRFTVHTEFHNEVVKLNPKVNHEMNDYYDFQKYNQFVQANNLKPELNGLTIDQLENQFS